MPSVPSTKGDRPIPAFVRFPVKVDRALNGELEKARRKTGVSDISRNDMIRTLVVEALQARGALA